MTEAIKNARNATITNIEELEQAIVDFEAVKNSMTLDPIELKFMISVFEKETNINNYYDETTQNNFQELLTEGKKAYDSGDEEIMYQTYVKMRNAFNDLCRYNTVYGNGNGDGKLTIADVTLGQKYIANIEKLNSSQLVALTCNDTFLIIITLTNLQKQIIGNCDVNLTVNFNRFLAYENIDADKRFFTFTDENINSVYSNLRAIFLEEYRSSFMSSN